MPKATWNAGTLAQKIAAQKRRPRRCVRAPAANQAPAAANGMASMIRVTTAADPFPSPSKARTAGP